MGAIDSCIASNSRYAAGFSAAGLPTPPAKRLAIVACMDARLETGAALGLAEGDAHVIRNAGGVVTEDVIRSIAMSQIFLGTREIMLILHTDCGMTARTEDELQEAIEHETGTRPTFAMHAFSDLDGEIRRSRTRLLDSPLIPHKDRIRGFVYDVETGRLREVE